MSWVFITRFIMIDNWYRFALNININNKTFIKCQGNMIVADETIRCVTFDYWKFTGIKAHMLP